MRARNEEESARLSQKQRELDGRENAIANHERGVGIPVQSGRELHAHYQHNSQPSGSPALEELIRLYPQLKPGSDRMREAAEKAKAQSAKERRDQRNVASRGEETSGTIELEGLLFADFENRHAAEGTPPSYARGTKRNSPTKTALKAKKASSKNRKSLPDGHRPIAEVHQSGLQPRQSMENDLILEATSEGENPEPTGNAPRGRKGKAAPSPKIPSKTPASSKRKKAVIDVAYREDEDHPGFLHLKTPGKRQRTTRRRE